MQIETATVLPKTISIQCVLIVFYITQIKYSLKMFLWCINVEFIYTLLVTTLIINHLSINTLTLQSMCAFLAKIEKVENFLKRMIQVSGQI